MVFHKFRALGLVGATLGLLALIGFALAGAGVIPNQPLSEKRMGVWWADLEKAEVEALRALLQLAPWPKEAVAFLTRKMELLQLDKCA